MSPRDHASYPAGLNSLLSVNVSVNLNAVSYSISMSYSILSTIDKMVNIPRSASLPPSRAMDKYPILASPGCSELFVVISSGVVLYTECLDLIYSLPSSPWTSLTSCSQEDPVWFRNVYRRVHFCLLLIDAACRSMGLGYFVDHRQPTNS